MRELTFTVTLRESTHLPISVVSSEARMKLWELLWQHLDIKEIKYQPTEDKDV